MDNSNLALDPLDATDRALIAALRKDARASVTELALTLDLSRLTVRARMDRLKAAGVIRRFTVELGVEAVESQVRAISMIEIDGRKSDAVRRALVRLREVESLHSTNGRWSFVVQTASASLSRFDHLLTHMDGIDGIKTVETCLLLNRLD
ncbi:MAG: Lrp/AsnC family transcriptional regulator [Pseudomonadota bacterium]